MNSATVHCPACHAACAKHSGLAFTAEAAAQHFVLEEEFPEDHRKLRAKIAELWGGPTCTVISCKACGLEFADPFVAGDAGFYNLAYPYSDYPTNRWEWDETVKSLQGFASDGKVLEIGSGFGYFLQKISPSLIPQQQVVAIEYNDNARRRLTDHGFTAYGEDVRSATFDPYRGQLGAVFIFQVLEHMDGLDSLVNRLNELCRPGARIFVAVPNILRIKFNEGHGSLMDMPPNHISRWTEDAFRALASRAAWEMVSFRTEPMIWRDFVKQDLIYSHMRRAQDSGSIANRIRGRPRSRARVAMESAAALLAAPTRVPAWLDAARSAKSLGDSGWAQFKVAAGR